MAAKARQDWMRPIHAERQPSSLLGRGLRKEEPYPVTEANGRGSQPGDRHPASLDAVPVVPGLPGAPRQVSPGRFQLRDGSEPVQAAQEVPRVGMRRRAALAW